jgi:hypothetical protein
MGDVDCGALKAYPMERCLYDYVLLGMNATTHFMPSARFYAQFIPEAAKLKTILKPRRSSIVASG